MFRDVSHFWNTSQIPPILRMTLAMFHEVQLVPDHLWEQPLHLHHFASTAPLGHFTNVAFRIWSSSRFAFCGCRVFAQDGLQCCIWSPLVQFVQVAPHFTYIPSLPQHLLDISRMSHFAFCHRRVSRSVDAVFLHETVCSAAYGHLLYKLCGSHFAFHACCISRFVLVAFFTCGDMQSQLGMEWVLAM